jgi:hypothetical protein
MGASSDGVDCEIRPRPAQFVDPTHFAEQPDHLPQGEQDAQGKTADYQAVQPRICHESGLQILGQDQEQEPREQQEDDHAQQIAPRRGQAQRVMAEVKAVSHAAGIPFPQKSRRSFRHAQLQPDPCRNRDRPLAPATSPETL